ncbi:MAG: energy transducer TonB [Terracidiphilus sp.]
MQPSPLATLSLRVCLLWVLAVSAPMAQTSQAASPESTSTAKALLLQAEKLNGLAGGDLKPWHLKISYAFLDASGKPTDEGTIESLWGGPGMVKTIYTDSTATLVYTTTKKGTYRDGEVDERMALLQLLADAFVRPMAMSEQALARIRVTVQTRQTGSGELRCFTSKNQIGVHADFNDPTYCLDGTQPIIRSDSFPDDPHQFMWNHIGTFQGRYVPMEILVGNGNGAELSAHLESLREIGKPDPGDFNPAPDAVFLTPAHDLLVLPGEYLEQMIRTNRLHQISCPPPVIPSAAKAANIHGTVRLRALIGTDGRIVQLHIIDGPALLQQAALDSVWKWKFEPPFHGSEHAQVLGEISVHF